MTEVDKHRDLVRPYCNGNGVDAGASGNPIVPWAIMLDLDVEKYMHYANRPNDIIHWRGTAENLPFKDGVLDFFHASHLLEDFEDWSVLLNEWHRALKVGGHMIIAVPDHQRFRAAVAAGQGDNLNHKHESFIGELSTQFKTYEIIMDRFVSDSANEYSIIFVAKKISEARG